MHPDWLNPVEYPFKSHYFESGGQKIHYLEEGSGETLVMLHGSATWSYLFRDVIKDLMDSYRCLVPDLPGFGLSSKEEDGRFTLPGQLEVLSDWVGEFGSEKLSFLGHGMGGLLALAYALRYPEKIHRLILCSSWAWPIGESKAVRSYRRRWAGFWGPWVHRRTNVFPWIWIRQGFAKTKPPTNEQLIPYLAPYANDADRRGLKQAAYNLWEGDSFAQRVFGHGADIQDLPVLVVMGQQDRLIASEAGKKWLSFLPQSEIEIIPRVGHYIPEEAGEQLVALTRRFLAPLSNPSTET
jgi:haloalkane dehalogenase